MSNSLIDIVNITKQYGHIKALHNISLSINKSDFVTIFGANGAGKSTLLKLISLQSRQTSGEINLSGVPYKKLGNTFKRRLGVISHQPFLYENLTAYENLLFYASLYDVKSPKKIVDDLLKRVDLFKRKDDLIRTYSRGMLQRASIIRALVHNPDIILLDEPYTGLDTVASKVLTSLLKDQLSDNKTIVMVTHDIQVGLELSSKIVIIKKGKVAFNENISDIDKSNFENIYIAQVTDKD